MIISMAYGSKIFSGITKKAPVIRGETGFTVSATSPATTLLVPDTNGIWLHNFVWGGINSGGVIESLWYDSNYSTDDQAVGHIVSNALGLDLRPVF